MQDEVYTEADWRLFRKLVPGWQEAYMERLERGYAELLEGEGLASEKFWKLEKRIRTDKKKVGVSVEMRRSRLQSNLVALVLEGAIGPDDLEGFSERLRDAVNFSVKVWRDYN